MVKYKIYSSKELDEIIKDLVKRVEKLETKKKPSYGGSK